MSNSTLASAASLTASSAMAATSQARLLESLKAQYQLDQQVKFLHLQAEAESLLSQLEVMKQQRHVSAGQ